MRAKHFCVLATTGYLAKFGTNKMLLSPYPRSVAYAALRFKTVVLLLLIHCLLLLPLFPLWFLFHYEVHGVISSLAILMGMIELVDLLL